MGSNHTKSPTPIRKSIKAAKRFIPDALYLQLQFRRTMGAWPDLRNPHTFNEKLQWLKLHDRNPMYTTLVDKIAVKEWVAKRIGEECVIPTYNVWDNEDDINLAELPDRFVLKTNHDSGGIAICRDRSSFDFVAAKQKLRRSMANNYYYSSREWPYKNVVPRVFAEQYLDPAEMRVQGDYADVDVPDYKFMCFNGEVKCSFTCTGRARGDLRVDFFDRDWNHLPFTRHYPNADVPLEAPESLQQMTQAAERLAEGIPFVRVDFYEVAGQYYFGEMTFYPGAGFEEFDPKEWDERLGSWIELPEPFGGGVLMSADWMLLAKVTSGNGEEHLTDYKVFCFPNGRQITLVCEGREAGRGMRKTFFDEDWRALKLSEGGHPMNPSCPMPVHFEQMKTMAAELSRGMPFVRVDFYDSPDRLLFGELTFYPNAGYEKFDPPEWDLEFGSWIDLPCVGADEN